MDLREGSASDARLVGAPLIVRRRLRAIDDPRTGPYGLTRSGIAVAGDRRPEPAASYGRHGCMARRSSSTQFEIRPSQNEYGSPVPTSGFPARFMGTRGLHRLHSVPVAGFLFRRVRAGAGITADIRKQLLDLTGPFGAASQALAALGKTGLTVPISTLGTDAVEAALADLNAKQQQSNQAGDRTAAGVDRTAAGVDQMNSLLQTSNEIAKESLLTMKSLASRGDRCPPQFSRKDYARPPATVAPRCE